MKGKVAGKERSSFTRRVRYWGKNIPLHRKNFFPHSLKLVKSKNHWMYLFRTEKRSNWNRSQNKLCPLRRHTKSVWDSYLHTSFLYRMNVTQTWTIASGKLVDIWPWNDSSAWTWQGPRMLSSHGYSAWGTTPACHAVWDFPVPVKSCCSMPHPAQVFCKKNPWINTGKLLRPGKIAKES